MTHHTNTDKTVSPLDITHKLALELFNYDAATGKVYWRAPRKNNQIKAGDVAGYKCANGYVVLNYGGRPVGLHRVIWFLVKGRWPKNQIDHINGVRDDNRLCNLRDVPRIVNVQNSFVARGEGSSKYIGVYRAAGRKMWTARITTDYKALSLGQFASEEEAAAAYLSAKKKLHPEAYHADK